jgi:hypothetical protein
MLKSGERYSIQSAQVRPRDCEARSDASVPLFGGCGHMTQQCIQRCLRDIRLYWITAGTEEIPRDLSIGRVFLGKKK